METAAEASFTPRVSLFDGNPIGLGAGMAMGRIAGISGTTEGFAAVAPTSGAPRDRDRRLAVVLGLVAAPLAPMPGGTVERTAGQVVGMAVAGPPGRFGRLGSGCTSGHGDCERARLSLRSLATDVGPGPLTRHGWSDRDRPRRLPPRPASARPGARDHVRRADERADRPAADRGRGALRRRLGNRRLLPRTRPGPPCRFSRPARWSSCRRCWSVSGSARTARTSQS